jgi:hypothetical protein
MLSERLTGYQLPYEQLSTLRGVTGSVDLPQFSNAPAEGVAPTDIAGLYNNQYQGQIDAYNAQQQSRNALLGGLFSLGGAALGGPIGANIGKRLAPQPVPTH